MKTKIKTISIGILIGLIFTSILVAGTEAVQPIAENDPDFTGALTSIVNFLPFPWNVVGGALIAAAGSLWVWRKSKKKTS